MTTSEQYTVIGAFDNPSNADQAVKALQQAGFSDEQIRHTSEEGRPRGIKALFSGEKTLSRKNLTNDLINMGVEPDDARIFQQEYEEGHPLVSVEGRGDMQRAIGIMVDKGAHGPRRRRENYEETGRGVGRADAPISQGPSAESTEPQKMRLHAEHLKAYKQPAQVGEVSVRKEVVTEQQTINVPVTREEVVVERRSLGEDAAAAEAREPIAEGEELRIPVREEQVSVNKEAVATGEVEISKRKVTENRQFSDTVRHEEPHIEKQGDAPILDTGANQPPPDQPQI